MRTASVPFPSWNIPWPVPLSRFLEKKAEELFAVDIRSLALFRISLGILLISDLTLRYADIKAFYTDQGLMPRAACAASFMKAPWMLSLHFASGSLGFQSVMFSLSMLAAVGLLLGFQTRLMAWTSWLLLLSLDNRNVLVLNGGDEYFRLLLMWGLFLPLGAAFSIDAMRRRGRPSASVLGWGSFAVLVQTFLVYFASGCLKWTGTDWRNGTAVSHAVELETTRVAMNGFLTHPWVAHALTRGILGFEIVGAIALLSPFRTSRVRTVLILCFAVMQLGLYHFFSLGLFPFVCLIALIPFVPGDAWQFVSRYVIPGPPRPLSGVVHDRATWISGISVIFLLVCGLAPIVATLTTRPLSPFVERINQALGTGPSWQMYAPDPPRATGWIIPEGHLRNHTLVNLFKDLPQNHIIPSKVADAYPDYRWKKYMLNVLVDGKGSELRKDVGRYFCSSWNTAHRGGQSLQSINLVYMEKTVPAGEEPASIHSKIIATYRCWAAPTPNG